MSALFLFIYDFFTKRKGIFYTLVILTTSAMVYFATKVNVQQNVMHMLPSDKNTEQFTKFFETSKFSDRIMICISLSDTNKTPEPDSLVAFADTFALKLKSDFSEYIANLDYVADDSSVASLLGVIDENLPLFLDSADYSSIDTIIQVQNIKTKIASNYRTLTGFAGIGLKQFIVNDPLGLNYIAYNKLKSFQGDGQVGLFSQHFVSKDQKYLFIFINPKYPSARTKENIVFFEKLDQAISNIKNSKYNVIYFGAPAVSAGNAKQINNDTILTVSLTVLLLIVIVSVFFKKITAPVLVLIPVLFGALFSLTMIYFLKGSISIIAIAAGSLILGIAINYSLHFLTHLKYHFDAREVIKDLAFPMTIGSATTVGGFLCLQFVKAPVLRDLGVFAAFSLIGAAIATLIIMPHLVSSKPIVSNENEVNAWYQNLIEKLQKSKYFLRAFLIATPILLYFAADVEFEKDMNKINFMSDKLKHSEQVLQKISSFYSKSVFVLSKGKTLDEALSKNEKLLPELEKMKANGHINSFTGVSTLLLSKQEQTKRINRWNNYWTTEKKQKVLQLLQAEGAVWGFKSNAFIPFENVTSKQYSLLDNENIHKLRNSLLKNFIEENNGEFTIIGLVKTTPYYVSEIYSTLSKYPDAIIFDRQYVTNSLVKIVSDDFNFITIVSSLLVFAALLLSYGRIELALITFIPMAISWIWILGLMALLGIKFNIVNIILSTLVFALGDDYSIFTMDSLQQNYTSGTKSQKSVTTSIILSVITTIVGLGILIFAKHPALQSIGLVSVIGILSVWLVSQTLQPLLFKWFILNPTSKKTSPYTFRNIFISIFAFSYFFLGLVLLTILGFILTKINPYKTKHTRYIYHWVLSKFTLSLVYIMSNFVKVIINKLDENFDKPAILIANHESFLDILVLIMQHPKLILFTNHWVWNSPFMGMVVRMADYSMAEHAANNMDKITSLVNEGYSIVIFPEGTRSTDGIKRFHKGAFLLAEQLQLDILPVVLHGTGYSMSKGDYLLKDGQVTLEYLPRISIDNNEFGNGYAERAKLIGRYFRQEHEKLSLQIEKPAYFKKKLFSNFILKGPVLEWYMKVKVGLEKNYVEFDNLLPKEGKILDIGCGYGFMAYMLGYTSKKRLIKGIDFDGDKTEVAQLGYLKPQNVSFEQANALEFNFDTYDAVVMLDMLHYLPDSQQIELLEKAVNSLSENGMLVVRDGIKELENRHKGTKLTEVFSTKIFKFNKTATTGLSFLSSKTIYDLAEKFNLNVTVIDNSKFTSNLIFVLKKQL